MKKIGLICLAVVLAVGGLGIGFAHWSDTLYINGTVETGEVLVGFVWQETDDADELLDPVNMLQEPVCAPSPPSNKHVATTTCELQLPRTHCDGEPAMHDGLVQYGKLHIDMLNVYPGYAPSVYFDIANCGTIPVVITEARIVRLSVDGVWRDVDIALPKCTPVQVDLDGDGLDDDMAIGFSMDPLEPDQQIDPCETIEYDLHFMFKQELNECTNYDFEIEIKAIQWNKA